MLGNYEPKAQHLQLSRLIYTSHHEINDISTFDDILQMSRANNHRDGISGALIISNDMFMQVLEGDRAAVGRCLLRITQDSRHDQIQIVASGDAEHRQFFEWTMHRIETSQVKEEILSRYHVNGQFRPHQMKQFAIEDLCRTLSAGQWRAEAA